MGGGRVVSIMLTSRVRGGSQVEKKARHIFLKAFLPPSAIKLISAYI